MNAKLVNAFLDAAIEVLSAEVGGPIERGPVSAQNSHYTTNEVNVHLAIIGRLEGAVIYSMSQDTALRIVSRMIGQTISELDELAQSGVEELGNVITGRAMTLLAGQGYNCTISVPTLILGKGAVMSIADYRRLVLPVTSRDGSLELHVALRELPD